jgi:hypothetical protein
MASRRSGGVSSSVSPHRFDAAVFAAGGKACSPRILGIGADSGHHEHRRPSTNVPTDASGCRPTIRRSMMRLVPQPGQNTSSHGVPESSAARIVGDHMSRPAASRSFQRSTTALRHGECDRRRVRRDETYLRGRVRRQQTASLTKAEPVQGFRAGLGALSPQHNQGHRARRWRLARESRQVAKPVKLALASPLPLLARSDIPRWQCQTASNPRRPLCAPPYECLR